MTDPMDQPVTRRELRQELQVALANYPTRTEMQQSFDAFLTVLMERLDQRFVQIDQRFVQIDQRFQEAHRDMLTAVRASADDVRAEMRTLTKVNETRHRDDIAVVDDKYKGLPARVKKLEDAVFKPAPLKRRRAR
jgi:hypothetical protein